MISPTPMAHAQLRSRLALWVAVVMLFYAPAAVSAQGAGPTFSKEPRGQQGSRTGWRVLGGAIGGVVGVFTACLARGKTGKRAIARGERAETGLFGAQLRAAPS